MPHHRCIHRLFIAFAFIAILVSACQAPATAPTTPPTQAIAQSVLEPTAAQALPATATDPAPAPTATPNIPTPTPSRPTQTPKPTKPAVTPLPGMVMYTHPKIMDHVFQVDPSEWMLDPYRYNELEMNFLRHRTLTNCRITPTYGRGGRDDVITLQLGLYTWEILFYKPGNPYQPAIGGPVTITFYNYTNAECQKAINTVLKNLIYDEGANKNPAYQAYQPPALTVTPVRMDCGLAYLHAGDQVKIVTDAVWLRSGPNKDASSKISRLTREKDWQIRVTGGPECGGDNTGKMVFWNVKVSLPGEAEQTGWLAEGDGYEPYLAVVE